MCLSPKHQKIWSKICPKIRPNICPTICPNICSNICPKICSKNCPRICPNICPRICPKICPKIISRLVIDSKCTLGLDTSLLSLLSTQLDRLASPKEHYLQLLLSHNIRVNACRGSVKTEHHYIPVHLTIVPIRK